MKKRTVAFCLVSGLVIGLSSQVCAEVSNEKALIKFGVVTDLHHTNKPDTPTRKYSVAVPKSKSFVETMEESNANFVIELGDFVDTLVDQKNPAKNLAELEKEFTSFNGPSYHVLGNHEFDNVTRELFLKSITNTGIPQGETYYSWDANGVHFVVLDAGYTNEPPHRAFDLNTPDDTFWNWKDAYIPEDEIKWLKNDLKKSKLPTIVFTHQVVHRVDDQDHTIKNASTLRQLFEKDGQVLAVFSGHDHQGAYANIKGIHYVVLNGNVGVDDSRTWDITSETSGFDLDGDNQFATTEITSNGNNHYTVKIKGYGRQPSYTLESTL